MTTAAAAVFHGIGSLEKQHPYSVASRDSAGLQNLASSFSGANYAIIRFIFPSAKEVT